MEVINLNLVPEKFPTIIHASQNDEGRITRLKLFNGPVPFKLSGEESLKLRTRQSDGTVITLPVENTGDVYVDIATTSDVTAHPGRVYCKLRINDLGTKAFHLLVEPKP